MYRKVFLKIAVSTSSSKEQNRSMYFSEFLEQTQFQGHSKRNESNVAPALQGRSLRARAYHLSLHPDTFVSPLQSMLKASDWGDSPEGKVGKRNSVGLGSARKGLCERERSRFQPTLSSIVHHCLMCSELGADPQGKTGSACKVMPPQLADLWF